MNDPRECGVAWLIDYRWGAAIIIMAIGLVCGYTRIMR